MRARLKAFSLLDLLIVVATVALLLGVGVPATSRVRELGKRSTCGVNLMGIAASAKVYAAANKEKWMVPAFKESLIDNDGIDYVAGVTLHVPPFEPGEVGYDREWETTSATPVSPNGGSTALSTTRAYWMLVRSGDVPVQQFICPSNFDDFSDPTEQIDLYYDFTGYRNIGYGYRVPFGPSDTRPREGMDHRQILAADKGPFYLESYRPDFQNSGENGTPVNVDDPPRYWRPFNSFNHGGTRYGEGQNALYADGHVAFQRIPAVGLDFDNVYTVMRDEWGQFYPYNRTHGDTPHTAPVPNPYPGQNAFGQGPGRYSSTDSLIYP